MKEELINKLTQLKKILSDPDSELMQMAEKIMPSDGDMQNPDESIGFVNFAKSLLDAASNIDVALIALQCVKEQEEQTLDEASVDELGALAQALDDTGDPILMKQASAIDELLLTVGADPKAQQTFKKAEEEEIERLRTKYRETRGDREYKDVKSQFMDENKVNEAIKAVEKRFKKYRPLEAPLSTRYSPDMPGVSLIRIGDGVYQCPVTKKIYDFRSGYTTAKGNKVPGTDVQNQTMHLTDRAQEHMNFSTREDALNNV